MVDCNGHILEVSLKEKAVDDRRNVVTGNGKFHSFLQTGKLEDLLLTEITGTLDGNASDVVLDRVVIVYFNGLGHRARSSA